MDMSVFILCIEVNSLIQEKQAIFIMFSNRVRCPVLSGLREDVNQIESRILYGLLAKRLKSFAVILRLYLAKKHKKASSIAENWSIRN